MTDPLPPSTRQQRSGDQWIEWLEQVRRDKPEQPLGDLLLSETMPIDDDTLVDLACIDLIVQFRSGEDLRVETLLQQFPQLSSPAHQLDLIDAELCIRRELEPSRDRVAEVTEYTARFPKLAAAIVELIGLDSTEPGLLAPLLPTPTESSAMPIVLSDNDTGDPSMELSFNAPIDHQQLSHHPTHPIDLPEWFIGQQCVASDEGRWLIRGRDASSTALAMKIIKFPSEVESAEANALLDQCEAAAKIKNPVWIAPSVAAVEDRHLAVIRPWVFGTQWQSSGSSDIAKRLRQLATVAYALAAAHQRGAVHGAVHAHNLVVGHDGHLGLVDAGASQIVFRKRAQLSAKDTAAWRRSDAQDFAKLVMHEVIDYPGDWSNALQGQMQQIITDHPKQCCGIIGDELIRRSDASFRSTQPATWRRRLSGWIDPSK